MYVEHEALNRAKEKMDKTISVFKRELAHIRAGRANPQLLDGVTVDYYGTPTPISQVGNISAPEPRRQMASRSARCSRHAGQRVTRHSAVAELAVTTRGGGHKAREATGQHPRASSPVRRPARSPGANA